MGKGNKKSAAIERDRRIGRRALDFRAGFHAAQSYKPHEMEVALRLYMRSEDEKEAQELRDYARGLLLKMKEH